jgi:hypothetical protein
MCEMSNPTFNNTRWMYQNIFKRFHSVVVMCPFGSLLVPIYSYFLLSYATSCHSVFIPRFLHHSRSLYSAPGSSRSERTYIKNAKSVQWIRLMTLLHAQAVLLFCLTPAPDEVFWKGRETRGYFLEMPFSWMCLLYTALTTPWTRVISTQHATWKHSTTYMLLSCTFQPFLCEKCLCCWWR